MSDADIKMSDAFDLPVITDYSGVIFDNYCCAVGEVCGTLDQSRLVSHAINSYDALIEQNKALRDALKDCVNDYINFDEGHLSTCIFMYAQKILKQSK